MDQFGEILHGHRGEYVTLRYGTCTEDDVQEFLRFLDVGDNDPVNRVVGFASGDLSGYLWQTLAASREAAEGIAGYQHVVYTDATLDHFFHAEDILSFPMAGARESQGLLTGEQAFDKQSRLSRMADGLSEAGRAEELAVREDLLGELICYIVGKLQVNARCFLHVLVPENAGDYQEYCLKAIRAIIRNIPAGMRRQLSFATNPADRTKKRFCVVFQREGGYPPKDALRLDQEEVPAFLKEHYLSERLSDFLKQCARDPGLAKRCYEDMEQELGAAGILKDSDYVDYADSLRLEKENPSYSWLAALDPWMMDPDNPWRRKKAAQLLGRAGGLPGVEALLEGSEEFQKAADVPALLGALGGVSHVLEAIRQKEGTFSSDFAGVSVRKLLPDRNEETLVRVTSQVEENKEALGIYYGTEFVAETAREVAALRDEKVCARLMAGIERDTCPQKIREALEQARSCGGSAVTLLGNRVTEYLLNGKEKGEISAKVLYECRELLESRDIPLPVEYLNICSDYHAELLLDRMDVLAGELQKDPEEETVRQFLELAEELEPEMPGTLADASRFVLDIMKRAYEDWRVRVLTEDSRKYLELFGQAQAIRTTLEEKIFGRDLFTEERKTLLEGADSCMSGCLLKFLNWKGMLSAGRLEEVLKLAGKIQNPALFRQVLEKTVTQYLLDDGKPLADRKEMYDTYARYQKPSAGQKEWYKKTVEAEKAEAELAEICRGLSGYREYFAAGKGRPDVFALISDGEARMAEVLYGRAQKETLSFDAFYDAAKEAEGGRGLEWLIARDRGAASVYIRAFALFYEKVPLGVRPGASISYGDLAGKLRAYNALMGACRKLDPIFIYFLDDRGVPAEKIDREAVMDALDIIDRHYNGEPLPSGLPSEDARRALAFLLPFSELGKKDLAQLEERYRLQKKKDSGKKNEPGPGPDPEGEDGAGDREEKPKSPVPVIAAVALLAAALVMVYLVFFVLKKPGTDTEDVLSPATETAPATEETLTAEQVTEAHEAVAMDSDGEPEAQMSK